MLIDGLVDGPLLRLHDEVNEERTQGSRNPDFLLATIETSAPKTIRNSKSIKLLYVLKVLAEHCLSRRRVWRCLVT
jgi:hypothetical protein